MNTSLNDRFPNLEGNPNLLQLRLKSRQKLLIPGTFQGGIDPFDILEEVDPSMVLQFEELEEGRTVARNILQLDEILLC